MRVLVAVVSTLVVGSLAATARADEPPAPSAPAAPVVSPPAATVPELAPTPDERRRVVEQVPPNVPPGRPAYAPTIAPPPPPPASYGPGPAYTGVAVAGCSDCAQSRDDCGWALDSCGKRLGCFEVTLAGLYSATGSPDGILGEDLFVPGNHLDWNEVDYDAELGGRAGISYRFEPQSRIEFVGTYYGSPDATDAQQGQFAARPGVTGLGDISRVVDATFSSEAETYSLELNWWTELTCKGKWRVDAGLGARHISFEETARVDFVTSPQFVGPFPVADGFVESAAENKFYGGQLCLAAHFDADPRWEFGASLKALFGTLDRNLQVDDLSIFAGGPHTASEGDDEFVFGVNMEVSARWRIAPKVAIFAGYDLLVLDNVQRAEDGMDFAQSNSGAVQAEQDPDQLVIHSLFVGVTFTF